MQDLKLALVQDVLDWEDPEANRDRFERALEDLPRDTDLVVLPEMFTTGFSMNAEAIAENDAEDTLPWLKALAAEHDAAFTGSLAVRDGDKLYNRLLWVTPDGESRRYDKRHLFTMSTENDHYSAGRDKLVVTWRDWRICPMVCYDLRFPEWMRNRPGDHPEAYDLLIVVANWPAKRAYQWRQLLIARAIENQARTAPGSSPPTWTPITSPPSARSSRSCWTAIPSPSIPRVAASRHRVRPLFVLALGALQAVIPSEKNL